MRIGLDTNILVYLAEVVRGPRDDDRVATIQSIVVRLASEIELCVPTQVFGELYAVLLRCGHSRQAALEIVRDFRRNFEALPIPLETFDEALVFATNHQFQIWDALIVTACEQAGCTLLLSEDMQDGFKVGSTVIANPFADKLNPKLARLLT
jgi:predicted nucleic acid-binding protein